MNSKKTPFTTTANMGSSTTGLSFSSGITDDNFNRLLLQIEQQQKIIKNLEQQLIEKNAEVNLKDKFTSIIRLPLIINFDDGKKGDLEIFYKYINLKLIPLYPMIYPGNIYRPIEIRNLCDFFLRIIENDKKKQTYNLMGKEQLNIWDLFNKIAVKKNKKTLKINISFLRKVLPNSIKQMIFKSSFFGQFLCIDQSKIETDDII